MDLSALKSALEPLTQFGNEELTFQVDLGDSEIPVSLRPLLPREEVLCQERASEILEKAREEGASADDPLTRTTALTYFDSFRVEVISYALVQIGDNDLRGLDMIETGEVLENGTPVKVPKQKALKDLIMSSWSRGMITLCFSKYGDMVARIADKADKIVTESVADLDAEIIRAESRLKDLKDEREKRAKGDPSITTEQIKNLVEFGDALESEIDDAVEKAKIQSDLLKGLAEDAAGEAEEPEESEPPEEAEDPPDAVDFSEAAEEPVEAPEAAPAPKAAKPSKKKPKKPRTPVTPGEAPPPTVAPELSMEEKIRNAQKSAQAETLSGLDKAVPAGHVTTPSGETVEAYRLPAETLSERGRKTSPTAEVPDPAKGTLNPNFKPQG